MNIYISIYLDIYEDIYKYIYYTYLCRASTIDEGLQLGTSSN